MGPLIVSSGGDPGVIFGGCVWRRYVLGYILPFLRSRWRMAIHLDLANVVIQMCLSSIKHKNICAMIIFHNCVTSQAIVNIETPEAIACMHCSARIVPKEVLLGVRPGQLSCPEMFGWGTLKWAIGVR